jgi:hypothetical protein
LNSVADISKVILSQISQNADGTNISVLGIFLGYLTAYPPVELRIRSVKQFPKT